MFAEIESLSRAQAEVGAAGPARASLTGPRPVARRSLERCGGLYAACPAMQQLFATIERVAPTSATAMILGESGSGKELVARRIHELSARSAHPFVAVNCGALPETLIESELFGHERGAFTGAARTHHGCFERADKGTLLLDEIAEMPADMQVRLLRVLESGRFTRVGGSQEIAADVRVLAATNRALGAAVADGKLREDLMYRLCVIPVEIPPLREREGDALLLAEMFLQEYNRELGTDKRFSAGSRERIAAHAWPGNVRELRNVVYRAFVLCDGEVDVGRSEARAFAVAPAGDDLRARPARTVSVPVGTSLEEAERALILATLEAVAGNKVKTADLLGISLKTLYNRLQAYRGIGSGAGVRPPGRRLTVVA
jgi:two-component system, NtrC family, response regulator HydG